MAHLCRPQRIGAAWAASTSIWRWGFRLGAAAASFATPGGRWSWLFALEAHEHLSQEVGELRLFSDVERGQERSFVTQVRGSDPVDQLDPVGGELHEHSAAVFGVWQAGDETGALKAVEAMGHRSGGAHQRLIELRGRQAVGRSAASEAGQDVP